MCLTFVSLEDAAINDIRSDTPYERSTASCGRDALRFTAIVS